MAVDIHRVSVDDYSFIRGAARIMWAGITVPFPAAVSDVVNLSTFDAAAGWNDLGATKTGIQISVNNAEEEFDVDQITGAILSAPTNWEVQVGTALAEFTEEKMQIAWEGGAITTAGGFKVMGVGAPMAYTSRRLAILYRRPEQPLFPGGTGGKLRAYFFRRVQRMPQESTVTHNKTGEQISVPVRWKALADTSITDLYSRFFTIHDQV